MNPATKEWIKLLSIVVSFGCGVTATAYGGGCKLWISILLGLSAAGTNVWHALKDSPLDNPPKTP